MNILIVEDDKQKNNDIVESIKKISKKIGITTVDNIYSAKELLSTIFFDILILDLNLPLEAGNNCDDNTGYDLFLEIQKIKTYKKPSSIIIITSYKNLLHKYKDEIRKKLFTIVQYSATETSWKQSIESKINYILLSNNDSIDISETGYNYDIAIVTAIKVEYDQVTTMLEEASYIKVKGDSTCYKAGYFKNNSIKLKVIVAMQHQMGIAASTALTMKMIVNFKPQYISMVGIAAGKKGEGNLGDIIVPFEVWNYGSGKISEDNQDTYKLLFKPDPKYLSLSTDIKELLSKDYSRILNNIEKEWKGNKPKTSLQLIKGPMACGSIVVQDEKIIKEYIDPHNRKVKGLDMESYGVFYAVENSYKPKPNLIVCKSICDFADKEKNDNYQNYAAYTSARFLYYLALEEFFNN